MINLIISFKDWIVKPIQPIGPIMPPNIDKISEMSDNQRLIFFILSAVVIIGAIIYSVILSIKDKREEKEYEEKIKQFQLEQIKTQEERKENTNNVAGKKS